ncbi:hypothetical protein PsorP6_008920 [Peronosclerospora sorghi]|uniref:Uncharacterized protein n=1 Tax=Peronosclerospora sorghi TaxID=230839 RepID=A0ACC0W1J2_9STRA|nr:hypothetical protein PsorP6_008920 [Peronosclerospora sorghi]
MSNCGDLKAYIVPKSRHDVINIHAAYTAVLIDWVLTVKASQFPNSSNRVTLPVTASTPCYSFVSACLARSDAITRTTSAPQFFSSVSGI